MKSKIILPGFGVLLIIASFVLFSSVTNHYWIDRDKLKTGDVIFQSTNSKQCEAVKRATNSKFSHVGMIIKNAKGTFVLEAIEPVSLTPLSTWISRGQKKYFEVRTPVQELKITPKIQKKLDSLSELYLTKHYDLHFNWSDEKLYCSELVWKIYKNIFNISLCEPKKMKDFHLDDPLVKVILQERYGNNVPLEDTVVAPEDLYLSSKLKDIN